ncbi:protein BIC1 [Vigna radiata var. radiata]|uniref:Protein BIC1 n=1 Tax=Vigna radiata var. radiata TaxID=3916 RepID=A0A1S3V3C6_VIGRR|nr:protein BIC1 [Vigna radiata var. radiata]
MSLFCMEEKTLLMSHQPSYSTESDNQIPPHQPSKPKKPLPPDDRKMGQEHQEKSDKTSKPHENKVETALDCVAEGKPVEGEASGRERLKRHRVEVSGRVWIPEIWGQEDLLKDWIDCTAFDAPLVPSRIVMARTALVEEGRRATSGVIRIENRC